MHGDHQDANLRMPPLDLLGSADPVRVRHAHVHQDYVGVQPGAERERLLPTSRLTNHLKIGLVDQHIPQTVSSELVVIDYGKPHRLTLCPRQCSGLHNRHPPYRWCWRARPYPTVYPEPRSDRIVQMSDFLASARET